MTPEQYADGLRRLANHAADDLAFDLLDAAGTAWVDTSVSVAPVDTGQLRARTVIRSQSATEIEIVSDVPYASYQEYGTRSVPATGYFRAGRQAAMATLEDYRSVYEVAVAQMIESGGHPRPRTLRAR